MTLRKTARDVARAALLGDTDFSAMKNGETSANNTSTESLPYWAVTVVRDRGAYRSKDDVQRDIELVISLRMEGGDTLEDDLDADAERIEDLVFAALDASPDIFDQSPADFEFSYDGSGAKRIGTALITFTCIGIKSILA